MNRSLRWTICACAACRAGCGVRNCCRKSVCRHIGAAAAAQAQRRRHAGAHATKRGRRAQKPATAKHPPAPAAAQQPKLPPRTPFTAADEAAATIPGMPDARFWADFEADFNKALPPQPGTVAHSLDRRRRRRIRRRPAQRLERRRQPAGLFGRHRREHRRADGAVRLCRRRNTTTRSKAAYTKITAADIFEVGGDRRELRQFLAAEGSDRQSRSRRHCSPISPPRYQAGRRLFVVTTDLDAERSVVWNMGAIAAHAGETAATPRSICSAACCWRPAAFPAPFRRC